MISVFVTMMAENYLKNLKINKKVNKKKDVYLFVVGSLNVLRSRRVEGCADLLLTFSGPSVEGGLS